MALRAGVVGHPIGHTRSPAIHNAALRDLEIDATFEAFDVKPERFAAFLAGAQQDGIVGLSVTVPHKTKAFELADDTSEAARATGAVNALVVGDALEGHNTDVDGFRRALADLGFDPAGKRALVLGAGGAARAVLHALRTDGATVKVANRTRARAEDLGAEVVDWSEVAGALEGAELLVNATSVGLSSEESPVPEEVLGRAASGALEAVLDVVYGPGGTALSRAAASAGLRAADGLAMLVYQAAAAFRLFFGREPSLEVMFDAVARTD